MVKFNKSETHVLAFASLLLLFAFVLLIPGGLRQQSGIFYPVLISNVFFLVCLLRWFLNGKLTEIQFSVSLKRTHMIQPLIQFSIFAYWGLFYFGVREHALLIIYQLVFAYLFQFVLSVLNGRRVVLGFALFPFVLSLNFFAWFRPEYFVFQLLLVIVGLLAKVYLRRKVNGQTQATHIFNPSAFPLMVLAFAVCIFGIEKWLMTQDLLLSFHLVPHWFFVVLILGCFSLREGRTAWISLGTAVTLISGHFITLAIVGQPLMFGMIYPSTFLALTLLVTDPVTTPKSSSGQFFFGVSYGCCMIFACWMLSRLGFPDHYDKVILVPFLNYFAPAFDRILLPQLRFLKKCTEATLLPIALHAAFVVGFLGALERNQLLMQHLLVPEDSKWERWFTKPDPRLLSALTARWREHCAGRHGDPSCESFRSMNML
jgi:hypothetical protein